MRTRVLAAVVISGVALTLSGCGSGHGGGGSSGREVSHFKHEDPRGDVLNSRSGVAVTQSTDVDLTDTQVLRTKQALRMQLSYVRLDPRADAQTEVSFKLKRPGRRGLLVTWTDTSRPPTSGRGAVRTVAHIGMTRIEASGDVSRPCAALTAVPNDTAGTLRIRVPGRCFGNPTWVKVVNLQASTRVGGTDDVDDAFARPGKAAGRSPKMVVPNS